LKPLIEVTYPEFEILEEATAGNGSRMRVRTLMQVADEVNGNGRVYPESILDREVLRLQDQIGKNCVYGESDHPGDGKSRIQNTASMLTKLEKKVTDKGRKEYWGEILVLNTSKGKDVQEILRAGGRLGQSSRGFGTTKGGTWNGLKAEIVQDDYRLKAFDFVIGQSVSGADVKLGEELDVVSIFESKDESIGEGGERPDSDTEKGERAMDMTLEKLKKDHSDLVEALRKEFRSELEGELRESLQKELDAKFEDRLKEELEKQKEQIKDEVVEEIRSSEEFASYRDVVENIASLLKQHGLVEAPGDDRSGDGDEKDKEIAKLKEDLASEKAGRVSLEEKVAKMEVGKHIDEVVAGKPHADLLKERLSGCKTVEEVDQRLEQEENYIKRIVEASGTPAGKGKVEDKEDNPPPEGDGQIDEEERLMKNRQRQLAGLPPLEEKK